MVEHGLDSHIWYVFFMWYVCVGMFFIWYVYVGMFFHVVCLCWYVFSCGMFMLVCISCGMFVLKLRGPRGLELGAQEDHRKIRISHSSSQAQDREDTRSHGL